MIIFLVCALTVSAYQLNKPPAFMQETRFHVERGQSLGQIAYKLKQANLIKNEDFFKLIAYALKDRHIKPGLYNINKDMTTLNIFLKLVLGDIITQRVTIPEGFNLYQIAQRLERLNVTPSDRFLSYAFNVSFLRSIGIDSRSAEGYLFPDTYVFPESSDAQEIISIMHKRMQGVLKTELAAAASNRFSSHEILTLASLIEKEAAVPSERRLIAGVFHNRLAQNWRLDCDPTVRYAAKNFDKPITRSQLDSDSPFNTYRHRGLPPTPICSPGRESIAAALNPERTEYMFFVSRNDRSHVFSRTLAEHNQAVQVYQR